MQKSCRNILKSGNSELSQFISGIFLEIVDKDVDLLWI